MSSEPTSTTQTTPTMPTANSAGPPADMNRRVIDDAISVSAPTQMGTKIIPGHLKKASRSCSASENEGAGVAPRRLCSKVDSAMALNKPNNRNTTPESTAASAFPSTAP